MSFSEKTCSACGQTKPHVFTGRYPCGSRTYIDDTGRHWHGKRCSACFLAHSVEWQHKTGYSRPLDEVTTWHIAKARRAERVAMRHFERIGYEVEITRGVGPDLKISLLGAQKTVEVKSTCKNTSGVSWFVAPVEDARRGDDFIAIVLPDDAVVVNRMAEHLALCRPSGGRTITEIIKARCPDVYRKAVAA